MSTLWTPGDPIHQAPNIQRVYNKPIQLQPSHMLKLWRHRPVLFTNDVFDLTLDAWQEDVYQLYMEYQRVGVVANKGPGKEQPNDTMIYTPKGLTRFGDLVPGDKVFAESGSPTTVMAIHPQGVKDVYKVTFDDGTFTECGLDHLWKVRGFLKGRNKKEWGVMTTKQILERGIVVMQGKQTHHHFQIPQQGKAQFPYKRLPIDPYVFGLWLGDGSKTTGTRNVYDPSIVGEICSRGYKAKEHRSANRYPNIYVIGIKAKLKKMGLIDKYSYEKSIPETFLTSSVSQRKELLRGLMDSDGTIDKRDSCMEFDTTSEKLARDVMFLVRSLGGKTTLSDKRSFLKGVEHRKCYRVRVTTDFNPFTLERKARYWKKPSQLRYLVRTIKNIDLVGKKESMCITVECPSHCYLTNDFIVTHNTFTLATLVWHFFTCHHMPKVAAIAITKDHLKANLWAELAKLQARSKLLTQSVEAGAERFTLKGHELYSFIDARSFPKQADNSQMASALAGFHSDNVMFAMDEAGMIPDAVLATADAALSTGDSDTKKARILAAGNPEVAQGMLYRASIGKTNQRWGMYHVTGDPDDPKRAPRVSVSWAREQIETYGKEDPWVLVNVFGKYPPTAMNTLLSESEISESMNKDIKEEAVKNSQHRLGVDVARGGVDRTVFARRRGLKAYPLEAVGSNIFGPELAGKIAFLQQDLGVERVFVDNTGGYGSSVIDSLELFPHLDVTPVVYNAKAQDKRYFNKRTEMWVRLRDWIKKGGQLPKDPGLAEELMMPKLIFHGGVFRLEEKEQIKSRLGRSPDKADALAQTFADVEQPSFFGDFSASPDGVPRMKSDHELREWAKEYERRQAGNYVSDESQIDKFFRPPPNYKA